MAIPVLSIIKPCAISLERPHPMLRAVFYRTCNFEKIPITDEVFHCVTGHEHFAFGNANVQLRPEPKTLGDHSKNAIGQLGSDATLDFRGKRRNDTLECFGASRGMNGGHDQVPGL